MMQIIVVGGNAARVGKTALACRLIARAAEHGFVVALKVAPHERRRRYEISTYAHAPRHVSFHDTDRYLTAGADLALLLEAGADNFRNHLAMGLRRARRYRPTTLVIESTTAGAELMVPHESWFVAGEAPWKPGAERHFARAAHIVRTSELAGLFSPSLVS